MEWKDVTTYDRYDKERIPTCFSTSIGDLIITVVSSHIYHKGEWVMHCYNIGINTLPLNVKTLDEAKEKAIENVKNKITEWYRDIQNKG